ncbi:MAG: PA2779 family protein, partial [Smithellaceae bacterium]|nr:PA2779 family protein [Smithellaceae bacterium]
VQEKLLAYGMSPVEVGAKLQSMSDEQVHMLAKASDRVLAGGDGIGFVIGILVIVLLVIVIMKLLNKQIIVK